MKVERLPKTITSRGNIPAQFRRGVGKRARPCPSRPYPHLNVDRKSSSRPGPMLSIRSPSFTVVYPMYSFGPDIVSHGSYQGPDLVPVLDRLLSTDDHKIAPLLGQIYGLLHIGACFGGVEHEVLVKTLSSHLLTVFSWFHLLYKPLCNLSIVCASDRRIARNRNAMIAERLPKTITSRGTVTASFFCYRFDAKLSALVFDYP